MGNLHLCKKHGEARSKREEKQNIKMNRHIFTWERERDWESTEGDTGRDTHRERPCEREREITCTKKDSLAFPELQFASYFYNYPRYY